MASKVFSLRWWWKLKSYHGIGNCDAYIYIYIYIYILSDVFISSAYPPEPERCNGCKGYLLVPESEHRPACPYYLATLAYWNARDVAVATSTLKRRRIVVEEEVEEEEEEEEEAREMADAAGSPDE
jgi:hypothetical protein